MKTQDLNKQPSNRANLSRNGFDMSQEFAFTASTGMILPIYQDFYNAGETAYYSGDLICRTQPLVTAAMADVDVYLDWFFVPMQMLFTLFGSKRWMTNDLLTSFYSGSITDDDYPICDIDSWLKKTTDQYNYVSSRFYVDGYGDGFECLGKSQFRLANHLGFNPYAIYRDNADADTGLSHQANPNVFPMFALAYQAIYQDYFRLPLDDFARRNVHAFNIDRFYESTTEDITPTPGGSLVPQLFCLHYRPRHMDYFTSTKMSPILSNVNMLGNGSASNQSPQYILAKINNYLSTNTGFNPLTPSGENYYRSAGSATPDLTSYRSTNSNVNTNNLRSLFAIEKLNRIIGRSKKDYDSQVLAHFGFEVPHDVKHELTHLKEQHTLIHIGEVISTADTYDGSSGSALGSIGGKGYGVISSKKPFKFTAPCDGIIMCCFSSSARMRYYGTFDKQNAVHTRLDFYVPEFDKLGMQPLYQYEAYGYTDDVTNVGNRIGWQYRYEQWKRKYNRVTEAFGSQIVYNQINQNAAWVSAMRPYSIVGQSSAFDPSTEWTTKGRISMPTDLNGIMVVPYTPNWAEAYNINPATMFYTDPFICAFRANVKKVSTMSVYGEPNLNSI